MTESRSRTYDDSPSVSTRREDLTKPLAARLEALAARPATSGRLRFALLFAAAISTACSIKTQVDPVPATTIPAVCIAENDQVWSKQFLPALREEFERRRIATSVYRDTRPADCRYHVTYTANWRWDMAEYLRYVDIKLLDGEQLMGRAPISMSARASALRFSGSRAGHTSASPVRSGDPCRVAARPPTRT